MQKMKPGCVVIEKSWDFGLLSNIMENLQVIRKIDILHNNLNLLKWCVYFALLGILLFSQLT